MDFPLVTFTICDVCLSVSDRYFKKKVKMCIHGRRNTRHEAIAPQLFDLLTSIFQLKRHFWHNETKNNFKPRMHITSLVVTNNDFVPPFVPTFRITPMPKVHASVGVILQSCKLFSFLFALIFDNVMIYNVLSVEKTARSQVVNPLKIIALIRLRVLFYIWQIVTINSSRLYSSELFSYILENPLLFRMQQLHIYCQRI